MKPEQVKAFVDQFLPIAQKMEEQYGIPAYALMAQVALETNFGTSNMAKNKNNYGGIGAYDRDPSQALTFGSPEEAIAYQARIQVNKPQDPRNKRLIEQQYGPTAPILLDRNNSPESVFAAMQDSPYSTDEQYAAKLMSRYQQIAPYMTNPAPTNRGPIHRSGITMNPSAEKGKIHFSPPEPSPPPPFSDDRPWYQRFINPKAPPGINPKPKPTPANQGVKYTSPSGEVSYINRPSPPAQEKGGWFDTIVQAFTGK